MMLLVRASEGVHTCLHFQSQLWCVWNSRKNDHPLAIRLLRWGPSLRRVDIWVCLCYSVNTSTCCLQMFEHLGLCSKQICGIFGTVCPWKSSRMWYNVIGIYLYTQNWYVPTDCQLWNMNSYWCVLQLVSVERVLCVCGKSIPVVKITDYPYFIGWSTLIETHYYWLILILKY